MFADVQKRGILIENRRLFGKCVEKARKTSGQIAIQTEKCRRLANI